MLKKALSYCLQEETPVSFSEIMQLQPQTTSFRETKPQKFTIHSQMCQLERSSERQPYAKQKSDKSMVKQSSQNMQPQKKEFKIKQSSPYESDWAKVILNKYYNYDQPTNTRRRTFSIQLNPHNVKYRIRDLSTHLQSDRINKF